MPPPFVGNKPSNAYERRKQTKNLEDFGKDLGNAVNGAIPSQKNPYNQVAVLGIHWENDQTRVAGLQRELLDTFRKNCNYYTESYSIPAQNTPRSSFALSMKLSGFSQKWAAPDALRIYVFSGHAEAADPSSIRYYLAGRADAQGRLVGPRIDWYRASVNVGNAGAESGGDILYIFDCRSSGAAATYDGPESLAVATWDATAGSAIDTSFTRVLIDELNVLNGESQSIAGIFASMFRNASQNQVEAPPAHIIKKGINSVTLAKLADLKQKKSFGTRKRKRKFPVSENRVLLKVQLEDDVTFSDPEQWKKWLTTNVPSSIFDFDITIESAFTGSRLLLVTVPMEVWTMLPANEDAYAFVAHVASNNVLPNKMRG